MLAGDGGLEGPWLTREVLRAGADTGWISATDACRRGRALRDSTAWSRRRRKRLG